MTAPNIPRRVHLIGGVPDGRAVIAAGDLFVVSSKEEGLNTSVLDAMFLAELTPTIRAQAGRLEPTALRTLDAIHIATAASLSFPDLDFVTYDDRQVEAARARGLRVTQPGR